MVNKEKRLKFYYEILSHYETVVYPFVFGVIILTEKNDGICSRLWKILLEKFPVIYEGTSNGCLSDVFPELDLIEPEFADHREYWFFSREERIEALNIMINACTNSID